MKNDLLFHIYACYIIMSLSGVIPKTSSSKLSSNTEIDSSVTSENMLQFTLWHLPLVYSNQ